MAQDYQLTGCTVLSTRDRANHPGPSAPPVSSPAPGERPSQAAGKMPLLPQSQTQDPRIPIDHGDHELGSIVNLAQQDLATIASLTGRQPMAIKTPAPVHEKQGPTRQEGGDATTTRCPFCLGEQRDRDAREHPEASRKRQRQGDSPAAHGDTGQYGDARRSLAEFRASQEVCLVANGFEIGRKPTR